MSQQGFPGNFIMPDDTADFPYSNLIVTKEEIQSEVNVWAAQAFDATKNNQTVADSTLGSLNGLISAALTLAQYYIQQITYQGPGGPGSTFENAREIPLDDESKCKLLNNLGNWSDPSLMFGSYQSSRNTLDGVEHIFFNLGYEEGAFTWGADGSLTITDKYKFTGIDDLGVTQTSLTVQGVLKYVMKLFIALVVGSPLVSLADFRDSIIGKALALMGAIDPGEPFDFLRWIQVNGQPATVIGNLEPMFIKLTYTPLEVCKCNKKLFFNAIEEGKIPFSALATMPLDGTCGFECASRPVGSGPDPFGLLQNYAPFNTVLPAAPSSWTFGGGGNYPKPFTSFAQRVQEANDIHGPYAMIDFGNPKEGTSNRISGRINYLSIVCNGAPNEIGFIHVDWYNADQPKPAAYGDNLSKAEWWEQCDKRKFKCRYGHLPGFPMVTVELAAASYAEADPAFYNPDIPLGNAIADHTLLLGVVMFAAMRGVI